MKFIWKGKWRKGEIIIEAETFQELDNALRELSLIGGIEEILGENGQNVPELSSVQGCSDAIRMLMESEWGKQPRTMNEIKKVLEANALYFSKGTLSGTLTTLTKRGILRRLKKAGKWMYFMK